MKLVDPTKDEVVFTLTLKQYVDGSCGIESKSENGNGMKLVDVRQLLQWASNRVQDEIMASTVKTMLSVMEQAKVVVGTK